MGEHLPRRLAVGIGCAALAVGCVVLIGGWFLGLDALKGVLPGATTMKANTALLLALLGAGLVISETWREASRLADTLAILAIALALATLAEYLLNLDLRIDQLLIADPSTAGPEYPGRPAASAALAGALLGLGLLSARRPAAHWLKTASATGAILIAWAALSSYVFGPEAQRAVPLFGFMALHTAISVFLLGIGLLATEPVSWPISTSLSNSVGAVICRWLLPPAVLAPPTIGWLLTRRGVLDLFPPQFDWAIYSEISSMGSVMLVLLLARRIQVIDADRSVAMELSRRDALTGLANRRAFDAFLTEAFKLARRHDRPLSLLMLDVDHFKYYNDEFGHPAGDELLRDLGPLLTGLARQTDLVARIGGEEFAIVLPETDLSGARTLAEDIRSVVERSAPFRRRITVSIGIATASAATPTLSQLVSVCDAALYRAKAAGRNRISHDVEQENRSSTGSAA